MLWGIPLVRTYLLIQVLVQCVFICMCVCKTMHNSLFIINLSFITRLYKTNVARKRTTGICKNNENKSKTRQPHSWVPSSIEISQNNEDNSKRGILTVGRHLI